MKVNKVKQKKYNLVVNGKLTLEREILKRHATYSNIITQRGTILLFLLSHNISTTCIISLTIKKVSGYPEA